MLLIRGYTVDHLQPGPRSRLLQRTPISLGLYELEKTVNVGAEAGTRWGRRAKHM